MHCAVLGFRNDCSPIKETGAKSAIMKLTIDLNMPSGVNKTFRQNALFPTDNGNGCCKFCQKGLLMKGLATILGFVLSLL